MSESKHHLDFDRQTPGEARGGLPSELYSWLFRANPESVSITRLEDGLYLDVTRGFEEVTGYRREEAIGRTSEELGIWEDSPGGRAALVRELRERGKLQDCDVAVRTKSGEVRHCLVTGEVLQYGGQEYSIAITRDITEQMQAREAARAGEERYRRLFATVTDAVLIFEGDTRRFVDVNEAALKLYGYTREEFLSLRHPAITAEPEDSERTIEEALSGELQCIPLRYHRRKDGTTFPVEISASTLRLDGRTLVCGVVRDVTERIKSEDAIRSSEKLLRSIFRAAPVGIGVDRDRVIIEANDSFCKMLGRDRSELIGRSSRVCYPSDEEYERVGRTKYNQIRESGMGEIEARLSHRDGRIIEARLSATPIDPDDLSRGMTFTALDITDRKRAEQQRLELIRSLENAQRIAHIGSWEWDLREKRVTWSKEMFRICGRDPKLGPPSFDEFAKSIHPDDREHTLEVLDRSFETGSYKSEYRLTRCDGGSEREVVARGEVVFDSEGGAVRRIGTLQDVTEMRAAQRAVAHSERLLRTVIDASPNSIFVKDRDGRYVMVNKTMAERNGLTIEGMIGMLDTDVGASWYRGDEDIKRYRTAEQSVIDTGQPLVIPEEEFTFRDGSSAWFHTIKLPLTAPDNRRCLLGVAIDITERRRAEAALRETEAWLRAILSSAPITIYCLDQQGRFSLSEGKSLERVSLTPSDNIGASAFELYGGMDFIELDGKVISGSEVIRRALSGEMVTAENRLRDAAFENHVGPLKDPDGSVVGVVGVAVDITDRRKAEEALSEARLFTDNLIETANVIIVGLNPKGKVILFNPAGERLTGYRVDELRGQDWFKVLVPKDRYPHIYEEFQRLLEGGLPKRFENPIRTKDGAERIISWSNNELREGDKIVGSISFGVDITEQKKAEEQLKHLNEQLQMQHDAMLEKNITLKEILDHIEEEKANYKHELCDSIDKMLTPIVTKLGREQGQVSSRDLAVLRDGLDAILQRDIDEFSANVSKLSPRELDVCQLIREGCSSKEISGRLNLSLQTVHKHRKAIRRKLQLRNREVNLASYLRSR
jgi:PAS domain S-box-containing protein